jgi:hypothetical protein
VDPWSPIVISLEGALKFSSAAGGVAFDLAATGTPKRIPWPDTPDDAWLVLDRNGNGMIDNGREMFGNFTPLADGTRAAHGYVALGELDANKDGALTTSDPAFTRLAIWRDFTRNGITETGELANLGDVGIVSISLRVKESRRTDAWGNIFRYRTQVSFASGAVRYSWDVYFPVPQSDGG